MLTIQVIEGKHVPVITCDRCSERIQDHVHGIALYEKPGAPVVFLHHACKEGAAHKDHHSLPLDTALVELVMSAGVNWDEAVRNRTKWSMLTE